MSDPDRGPERLIEISSGFMEAKVLLAGAELGVFDRIAREGTSAQDVARAVGGTLRGTEILLDALVAIGVLVKSGGLYRNRAEFEPLLTSTGAGENFLGGLRHRNRVFRTWAFIEEKIREQPVPEQVKSRGVVLDETANENFIRAMYAYGAKNAPTVADRIDLNGVGVLADLGGGPGHYLAEFARRSPTLTPYLIDLPMTLTVARKIQADNDVFNRVRFVEWDFYHDPAPSGLPAFDLVFISAVFHAESPERNQLLLKTLEPLVSAGGRIVVQENVVEPDRTSPIEAALFAVNMLAGTDGGRTYTIAEMAEWGRKAGFQHESSERLSSRSCLVTLRRIQP